VHTEFLLVSVIMYALKPMGEWLQQWELAYQVPRQWNVWIKRIIPPSLYKLCCFCRHITDAHRPIWHLASSS